MYNVDIQVKPTKRTRLMDWFRGLAGRPPRPRPSIPLETLAAGGMNRHERRRMEKLGLTRAQRRQVRDEHRASVRAATATMRDALQRAMDASATLGRTV